MCISVAVYNEESMKNFSYYTKEDSHTNTVFLWPQERLGVKTKRTEVKTRE